MESKTNNLIKDMIPRDILRQDTLLIIINAIYFLGEWVDPFFPGERGKFYISEDLTREVLLFLVV